VLPRSEQEHRASPRSGREHKAQGESASPGLTRQAHEPAQRATASPPDAVRILHLHNLFSVEYVKIRFVHEYVTRFVSERPSIALSPAARARSGCGAEHPRLADSPWALRCRPLRGLAPVAALRTHGSRTRRGLYAVARCAG
jgi:hypothetical protein